MRFVFLLFTLVLACTSPQQRTANATQQGSGDQWTGSFSAPETPRGPQFELNLNRPDTPDRIGLARYGRGLPEPGRYKLGVFDRAKPGAFYATYSRRSKNPPDTSYGYVSTTGELVISRSSPERVEGTIHFTGAEYSAGWSTGRRGSGSPDQVSVNAPTIVVSASFSAIPFDTRNMHVCVGTGGPSVVVEVRDTNGRPSAVGATLEIHDGSFRDTSRGSWDSLHIGAGERRLGTYEGRVTKPWYKPVVIHGIRAPGDTLCHYAEPTDIRKVTLELLPNAPSVRQVLVEPASSSLGIPGWPETMSVYVVANPGVSTAVTWSSSDTTVVKVSQTGVVIPQCRRNRGIAKVIARSVVDPRVSGFGTVEVDPIRDSSGLEPREAREKADDCQRRLGR